MSVRRRHFLQLLGGSAMMLMAGCSPRAAEELVPYVHPPDATLPEESIYYASTLPYRGFGRGVLVESIGGRPVKVEGNPMHPAALGGSDVLMQAALLDLYDAQRPREPLQQGQPQTWQVFLEAVRPRLQAGGAGLHVLTRTVASPTLERALQRLGSKVQWHRYDPLWAPCLAYGDEPVHLRYRVREARTVVSFEQDFLGTHPERVRLAREWSEALPALYVAESTPTLTGGRSRHRQALPPAWVEHGLWALAARLQIAPAPPSEGVDAAWLDSVVDALQKGGGLVMAGETLSPEAQSLAARINARLGAPVDVLPPVDRHPQPPDRSMEKLMLALDGGEVETLLILGGNPAYEHPALARALSKAPVSVYHGLRRNETSALCQWTLPATHELEAWGDLRSYGGTLSLIQPLIQPLYDAWSHSELLARLAGGSIDGYRLVRETWEGAPWEQVLRLGYLEGSMAKPLSRTAPERLPKPAGDGPVVVFRPDEAAVDGEYLDNAWLQECPRSFSKQVWGNAVLVHPRTAARLNVAMGDHVRLTTSAGQVTGPVFLEEWQAEEAFTVTFGYGRPQAGPVAQERGFDVYPLRPVSMEWSVPVQAEAAGGWTRVITTQEHHGIEKHEIRQSEPVGLPGFDEDEKAPEQWGMVIDLEKCIGCNACVIACQVENNVAVVGPEEVERSREMHWLRVDRASEKDVLSFRPMPCMHCENAPCERVCPVEATLHSHDGLNQMIYNRCVGTRYCSNNCPYKVRRFNYLRWEQDPAPPEVRNPNVTVRDRGVMEKCTYCVQRIREARIVADRENRPVRDGEVRTACQDACPTRAIVFGNLADPSSEVARWRDDVRNFALLGELNTRPRTTFLSRERLEPEA